MSGENIDTVRRALDAFSRRDLPGLLDELDPEVEWRPLASVWERTYRGHAGVERWWRELADLWDEFEVRADAFRELGDRVLVTGLYRGMPKGARAEISAPLAFLVSIARARAARVEFFLDESRALAAAGLRK